MLLSVENGTRAFVQADNRALNEQLTKLNMNVTAPNSVEYQVARLLVSLVECNSFLSVCTDIFQNYWYETYWYETLAPVVDFRIP